MANNFGEVFNLKAIIEVVTKDAYKEIDKVATAGKKASTQIDLVSKASKEASTPLETLGAKGAGAGKLIQGALAAASTQALKLASGAVLGALGSAITAVGTTAVVMGQQIHDAVKRAQADFGLTTDAAKEFGDTLSRLWVNNTEGVDEISSALGEVNRRFKDLKDGGEAVTQMFLEFGRVNKTDVATATKDVAGILKQYKLDLEDLPAVLDSVTTVSQQMGAPAAEILKSLPQARTYTEATGSSLQQDAAYVGSLIQSGGDVGAIRGGLQTLGEAIVAPTPEQVQAFQDLGVASTDLATAWSQINEAARKGEVTGAGKKTAFMRLLGEGDSAAVLTAMAQVGDGYDDLVRKATENSGQVAESAKVLKESFGDGLTTLFRETIGEMGVSIGNFLSGPAGELLQFAIDLVRAGKKMAEEAFTGFVSYLEKSFPNVIKVWGELGPELQKTWDTFSDGFQGLVDSMGTLWEGLTSYIGDNLQPLLDVLDPFVAGMAKAFKDLLSLVNLALDGVGRIGAAVGAASVAIGESWGKVVDGMTIAWENFTQGIKDLFADALEYVLAGMEKLPSQAQEALGAGDLRGQIDSLRNGNRPQKSLQDAVNSFSSAGSGLVDSVFNAFVDQDKRKAAKPKAEPTAKAEPGKPLGVPKDTPGDDPAAERARREAAAARIKEQTEELEFELRTNKISEAAAVKKYQAILQAAKAAKLESKDVREVEQGLFDLQKDITERIKKSAEEREKAAQKAMETTQKLKVERIGIVKGETAAALEQLEIERREYEKLGADSVEIAAWYGAQRQKIFAEDGKQAKEDAEKAADAAKTRGDAERALAESQVRAQQAVLEASGKTLEAQILGMTQQKDALLQGLRDQRDEIIKAGGDKLAAEKAYQDAATNEEKAHQARLIKIQEDAAKDKLKVENQLAADILRLKADAAKTPGKAQELNSEADRAERLQTVKDRVAELRKQGIGEDKIREYVKAEQGSILAGPKKEQSSEEGTGGFSLPSFSNTNVKRRGGSKEDRALAAAVGALAYSGPQGKPGLQNIGGTVGAGGVDPATAKALSTGQAGKPGVAGVTGSAAGKDPSTALPTAEVNLNINISHDGQPASSQTANSREQQTVNASSTYTLGRTG